MKNISQTKVQSNKSLFFQHTNTNTQINKIINILSSLQHPTERILLNYNFLALISAQHNKLSKFSKYYPILSFYETIYTHINITNEYSTVYKYIDIVNSCQWHICWLLPAITMRAEGHSLSWNLGCDLVSHSDVTQLST